MLTQSRSATDDALLIFDRGRPYRVPITLAAGQNLPRGAVLGRSSRPSITATTKSGGNTGNGALTELSVDRSAAPGVYRLRAVAAADGLQFGLTVPAGDVEWKDLPAASGGWLCACPIGFVITPGSTPFAAGDGFDITVTAAPDTYCLSAVAASDGSAAPTLVLAEDTDASKGAVETKAYRDLLLRVDGLTFGAGHSSATVEAPLSASGIVLVQSPR